MAKNADFDVPTSGVFTARLTAKDTNYLMRIGHSPLANKALKNVIAFMRKMEGQALADMVRRFEPDEWKFMALMLKHSTASNKDELLQDLVVGDRTNDLPFVLNVDYRHIVDKIANFTDLHAWALINRIQDYWSQEGVKDMDEWAESF